MLRTLAPLLLAAPLLLGGPASPAQVDDGGLPSLGGSHASLTLSDEHQLGRAWLRQFRARAPLWDDPHARDYVERQIARLLPHSELPDARTLVVLVDSHQLNAFAVPGGVVGVNAGLFAFAEDGDAFASVIAHELGHLSQRHHARRMERAEQTQVPAMAAFLAGMLIAASGGGDAGMGVAMGSQAAFIQDQLAYSRRFEQEADRIGLQAMARAGIDPQAMVRMLRAMHQLISLQGGMPPEFLLTHPLTESRLGDVAARAERLTMAPGHDAGPLYAMIRARALLAIHRHEPRRALTRLEGADAQARRYLEALIAAEEGRTDAALAALDSLARELPDLALLPASAAEIAFGAGRTEESLERSRRLLRLMPDYLPAQRLRAEALLQQDADQAYHLLRRLTEEHAEDPQGFALLAEAAGRSGREAWGHLARAEHLQLSGEIDRAIRQLEIAERVAEGTGDPSVGARIAQRRDDFLGYRETLEKFQ
ncbi:M48 family metalloprotease [Bisbaumannia pacifica]|uniref:Putative beta-barrel assembly-enhancing protease n=1 Tax=Bisbaumannia pacifica TaxID=77098 RepID=A0ABD4L5A7_9GAMM|nr:M48 family metalloprotease [Halomonas pacifica]MBH8581756.1 M48 family metalloprotease [Halomonas pacifica]